jgi:aspartate racemase
MISGPDKKTLGIIGGMGPMATADLFYKIIANTDADSDAGHIRILIDNNPQIPDRTKAVLEGSDAPLSPIVEAAGRLAQMGAELLLLPCNTSHVYYPRICEAVSVPVINMVEETAAQAAALGLPRVGLLATKGTLYAKLYEKALAVHGIEAVLPTADGQTEIMSMIYDGIKAGAETFDTAMICRELGRMMECGAETFILGCTELPLAFERYHIAYPSIDPALILAKAAIVRAGYRVKGEVTALEGQSS